MALIYPFDSTLKGHLEVWNMKTDDLNIPMFAFPKGSFFVANTYAIDKATKKILRPGLDYIVLSCNQDIPYSTDAATETKMRNAYIRNAVLLKFDEPKELEWHIAYCGGEQDYKPAEYANHINAMLAKANLESTVNFFLTEHQGWGVYVSHDNTQIVQGKYINTHHFLQDEERDQGKMGGLGWGKVELAFHAISDVIANGTDPMLLEAFYNWLLHNEIEFNKVKDDMFKNIYDGLENLKGKRLAEEQFFYSSVDQELKDHNFIEHKNLTLRGIDPNETDRQTTNPTKVLRKGIGFFALGESNSRDGIEAAPTYLKQMKAKNHVDKRITVNLKFRESTYESSLGLVKYSILVDADLTNNPNAEYTIYVASKQTGRTIYTHKHKAGDKIVPEINGSYNYLRPEYSADTFFVYALDNNLDVVNGTTGITAVSIIDTRDAVTASISGVKTMLSGTEGNAVGLGEYIEVVINRSNPTNSPMMTVILYDGLTKNALKRQNIETNKNVNPVIGLVSIDGLAPSSGYIRVSVVYNTTQSVEVGSSLIGVVNQAAQKMAYIEVVDDVSGVKLPTWEATTDRASYLKVTFSEDVRFHDYEIIPVVSTVKSQVVKCTLGEPTFLNENTAIYKMIFTGEKGILLALSLTNPSKTLVTNSVNLSIEKDGTNISDPVVFDNVVRGRNYNSYNTGKDWVSVLELDTSIQDNTVFDISSTQEDIKFASSCLIDNGKVKIRGLATRYIYEAYDIVLTNGNVKYTIKVPVSTIYDDITIIPHVQYPGKLVSNNIAIMNEYFDVTVSNPVLENTVTLQLRDYKTSSAIVDVEFYKPIPTATKPTHSTKDVFKDNVVIAGGTDAVLNKIPCMIVDIETSANMQGYGESNLRAYWCPPYDVVVRDAKGNVLKTYGLETVMNLRLYESMSAEIANIETGLPDFNIADTETDYILTVSNLKSNQTIGNVRTHYDGAHNTYYTNYIATILSNVKPTEDTALVGLKVTKLNLDSEVIDPNIKIQAEVKTNGTLDYYVYAIIGVIR